MRLKLTFLILFTASIALGQRTSEYIISISKNDPFVVDVKVKFATDVDTVYVHPACPNYDYPEGWSTFIEPTSESLNYIGNSTWVVGEQDEITYSVDLSFVKEKWEVGNEQAGYYQNSSMFIVTRALFLFDNSDRFVVNFNLQEGYTIAAPWLETQKNRFLVSSIDQLNNNTLVWGKIQASKLRVNDFSLQIASIGYESGTVELFESTFKQVLGEYLKIFPQTPESNYLITVFPASNNDGEAYQTSHAFTLKSIPSTKNRFIWSNQFAHELFHFWNGRMINGPDRKKRQWFSEGFTEYMANMALVRTGIISEGEFYEIIENIIGPYYYFKAHHPEVSLSEAGTNKFKYRLGVYNGGWCAAFVMDLMIREKFPDKDLRTYMNILFLAYGLGNVEYVSSNLQEEFSKFNGGDEHGFFERFINGIETLPIPEYLAKVGLDIDYTPYEATSYLFKMDQVNQEQLNLKSEWLSPLK